MEKNIEIPVLTSSQHGREIVVGAMPLKDLEILYNLGIIGIDQYIPGKNEKGYQRATSENRAKKFGRFISDPSHLSPPAITLYIRERNDGVEIKGTSMRFAVKQRSIPAVYVADGMHRIKGLMWARQEGFFENPEGYNIPFTATVAQDDDKDPRLEEAELFFNINQQAKRVRTDLALQYILKAREARQGRITNSGKIPINVHGSEAKAFATDMVARLASGNGVWKNRVALANEEKRDRPSLSEFVRSLVTPYVGGTSIFDWASTKGLTVGELQDLLENYWAAIFEMCPKAADSATTGDYLLTKTTGIHSLHGILPVLLVRYPDLVKNPSIKEFQRVLASCSDFLNDNFWHSKNTDGASSYGTNGKGFRMLAEDIFDELG